MVPLSEHQIQSAFFDWAKMHPVAKRAYAVPNAAKRGPRLAAMMLREGLRKGVLDVNLPVPSGQCHGLFIEFKAGKNTLSPEQASECELLANDGYAVIVAWDTMMAIDATQKYLNGLSSPGIFYLKPAKSRASTALR